MNRRRIFFFMLTFLGAMAACVIPGLPSASTPAPAPFVKPGRLETMVAKTVSAAITQTEKARPTLRPTSTPTPTISATTTSSAPQTIPSGSTLTVQTDGSTVFADDRAGFEITIPAGWLAVRVKEQEYLDAFSLAEAADEQVQKTLLSIQNQNPDKFRLFSFDVQKKHIQKEFVSNFNFVWDSQGSIDLDNDKELKTGEAQLMKAQPALEILTTKISSNKNTVPLGLIESKFTAKNSSGTNIVISQKQVIFNAKTGTIVLTLSTLEDLKDTIFPEFDKMTETIKVTAE